LTSLFRLIDDFKTSFENDSTDEAHEIVLDEVRVDNLGNSFILFNQFNKQWDKTGVEFWMAKPTEKVMKRIIPVLGKVKIKKPQ